MQKIGRRAYVCRSCGFDGGECMDKKLPTMKRNRLKDYDYSSSGMYFITICTKDKKNILWAKESSDVVGEDSILPSKSVKLSQYGQIVDETINSIPTYYPHVTLLQYVIMPNHVHLILYIPNDGGRILSSPTTNRTSIITVIGQMKRQVSKNGWRINLATLVPRSCDTG